MRNIFTIFIKGRKNNELDLTEYSYAAADGETYGRRYFTGGKGGSATGGGRLVIFYMALGGLRIRVWRNRADQLLLHSHRVVSR